MEFKPGDFVKCLKNVEFIDGTNHVKGEKIQVTEENVDFFNHKANNPNYFLIGHVS